MVYLNDQCGYGKLNLLGGARMVKDQEEVPELKEGDELLFFEKYVKPLSEREKYRLIKVSAAQSARKRFVRFCFWRRFTKNNG